ncbi:MAG: hypothetical protein M1818_008195 [Claussenomyces sp. TS43310]|nr:MAG: hypothetical protein M1818_008195 [Claussenomyces sp. TS43310]
MSGRSAFVRKEKVKVAHDGTKGLHYPEYEPASFHQYPATSPPDFDWDYELSAGQSTYARSVLSSESGGSGSYARARRPYVANLQVSGIEKSSFREKMDKKSDNVRKGLTGFSFGKKKKEKAEPDASRPPTSGIDYVSRPYPPPSAYVEDIPDFNPPPLRAMTKRDRIVQERLAENERILPGPPPLKRLPSLPPPPPLTRWMGNGRAAQPWDKLRKDPELWDPNGDTLVFLDHETQPTDRPSPSFRVSSRVLEATESEFLLQMLQEGYVDFSFGAGASASARRNSYERGHVPSYELYLPPPPNPTRIEAVRHNVATRNVFALLYQASLVGLNFLQALHDLQRRLEQYMPPDTDSAGLIIDYVAARGLDDVRNDPSAAAELLVWSEKEDVRWHRGWREAFIHCVGMQNKLDSIAEYRQVSTFTRALLERASLEVQVRTNLVEELLKEFNFGIMWPTIAATSVPPPERAAFQRLQFFLRGYYEAAHGSWPVRKSKERESWLTRSIVQGLQEDFGALYDCLVDRDVVWDCSEERSSRKWVIQHRKSNKSVLVDTDSLPMTDMLIGFDNSHQYPHIPHPYPLVPEAMPALVPKENLFKASKKQVGLVVEDHMAKRKAALAYTEATNVYMLGSDLKPNAFVDAFLRFEKEDKIGVTDPAVARQGRWVLIYGILQVLASISVDTPGMTYTTDVEYHLNPKMRGTPPWKGPRKQVVEATHEGSHCWQAPLTWARDDEADIELPLPPPSGRQLRSNQGSVHSHISDISEPKLSPSTLIPIGQRGTLSMFPQPPSTIGSVNEEEESISQSPTLSFLQNGDRLRPRRIHRSSKRSSLATSISAEDDVPGLDASTTYQGQRPDAQPVRSPTVASFSESETGSSTRSRAASRRPYREHVAQVTRNKIPEHDFMQGRPNGVQMGYGSGIEIIDDWSAVQRDSNPESALPIIKDFDQFSI